MRPANKNIFTLPVMSLAKITSVLIAAVTFVWWASSVLGQIDQHQAVTNQRLVVVESETELLRGTSVPRSEVQRLIDGQTTRFDELTRDVREIRAMQDRMLLAVEKHNP